MIPAIDDTEWPIVRITYGETIGLDEIPEFARRLGAIFTERGPFVTVADISAQSAEWVRGPDSSSRPGQVSRMTKGRARDRKRT
jgi:hypothetical protein